jgi:hypothetical protein
MRDENVGLSVVGRYGFAVDILKRID